MPVRRNRGLPARDREDRVGNSEGLEEDIRVIKGIHIDKDGQFYAILEGGQETPLPMNFVGLESAKYIETVQTIQIRQRTIIDLANGAKVEANAGDIYFRKANGEQGIIPFNEKAVRLAELAGWRVIYADPDVKR
jgi:hypothetical protein